MPRKKKNGDQPIGVGLTSKQMKRKKPINADMLRDVEALTDNQKALFDSYAKNKNLVAYGAAGTGKTFITLFNALGDVLDPHTPYDKIYIVRSLVATREIGFLPGDHEDKSYLYQIPYKNMLSICLRCLVRQTLRCCMATSKHRRLLDSGAPHSLGVQH